MMSNLRLEGGQLETSRAAMDQAITTFAQADRVGDDLAGLTGHDGLAGKVRDFADNWDRKRGQLQKGLEGVRDALQAITDTFRDLDRSMAKSLTDSITAAPVGPTPGPGGPTGPTTGTAPDGTGGPDGYLPPPVAPPVVGGPPATPSPVYLPGTPDFPDVEHCGSGPDGGLPQPRTGISDDVPVGGPDPVGGLPEGPFESLPAEAPVGGPDPVGGLPEGPFESLPARVDNISGLDNIESGLDNIESLPARVDNVSGLDNIESLPARVDISGLPRFDALPLPVESDIAITTPDENGTSR